MQNDRRVDAPGFDATVAESKANYCRKANLEKNKTGRVVSQIVQVRGREDQSTKNERKDTRCTGLIDFSKAPQQHREQNAAKEAFLRQRDNDSFKEPGVCAERCLPQYQPI